MTVCRRVHAPPELEEEAFRLADEWVEIDTSLSIMEYIYNHGSPELKEHMDQIERSPHASDKKGQL